MPEAGREEQWDAAPCSMQAETGQQVGNILMPEQGSYRACAILRGPAVVLPQDHAPGREYRPVTTPAP